MVGRGVVTHRVRQASLLLQIIVAPAAQFAHGMLGEEIRGATPAGQLPQRGLGAVLAEFKGVVVRRLGPGTGYAHETLGLVLPPQGVERRGRIPFLAEDTRDPPERSPAPGRSIIFDGAVFFDGVIFTFKWGVGFRHDTYLQSTASQPLGKSINGRWGGRFRFRHNTLGLSFARSSCGYPFFGKPPSSTGRHRRSRQARVPCPGVELRTPQIFWLMPAIRQAVPR